MCRYRCPYAERRKCADFLLCRRLERPEKNYNDRTTALTAICLYQSKCGKTGHMENTDSAKKCFEASVKDIVRGDGGKE